MINFAPVTRSRVSWTHPRTSGWLSRHICSGRNLKQPRSIAFASYGVSALNLCKPWSTQVDRVVFDGEYFLFADDVDDHGEQVFTMGVISSNAASSTSSPGTRRPDAWRLGWASGSLWANARSRSSGKR